ncbi:MAG: hypothetical protein IKM08_01045 [Clostridia bacterium]|nr:hypothetical protein [Clostridia bacterium]
MKRFIVCVLALLLATVLLLTGCSSHGATLIEAGDNELSVNLYRFYLSRVKGELARQGDAVGTMEYWNTYVNDTQTRAQFRNQQVLVAFKQYVAALMLYDELGLELGDDAEAQIDADIQEMIDLHANGSETELDALLSGYGANTTVFRDSYVLETKLAQLKAHLFGENGSLIDPAHKESFYRENYIRGKQIWLADSYYAYEADSCGNPVYYLLNKDGTLGAVAYDTVNGVAEQTEDGKTVYRKFGAIAYDTASEGVFKSDERDEEGYLIYYTGEDKVAVAYDTVNGVPATVVNENGDTVPEIDDKGNQIYRKWVYAYVTDPTKSSVKYQSDKDGKLIEKKYSSEEVERRLWWVGKIYDTCMKVTDYSDREATFSSFAEMYSDAAVDNGMYFMKDTQQVYSDVPTLESIGTKLQELEVGELHVLRSDTGYHLLMRCELDAGAWGNADNAKWFATSRHHMVSYLIEHMLLIRIEQSGYLDQITVDEELLKGADIAALSPNYRY